MQTNRCIRTLLALAALTFSACDEPFATTTIRHYTDVTTGGLHSCAIDEAGAAYCWGEGELGQLGIGTDEDHARPRPVNGNFVFDQISAGEAHTCGLTVDGLALCWGWNWFHQLGTADQVGYFQPATPDTDVRFVQISAGAYHNCALATDGRVFCWGYNNWGQNGNGTQEPVARPEPVSGDLRATAISAGAWHTCALTESGEIYCWGRNDVGQLGHGTGDLYSPTPALVTSSVRFNAVDAGDTHTCAISRDRKAYCWGSNEYGELGDGAPYREGLAGPSTPVPVIMMPEVVQISAGKDNTCAIATTGLGYCWGRNDYGQLGVGSNQHHPVRQPIYVLPLDEFKGDRFKFTKIAAGGTTHACGIVENSIFCWGTGTSGQLGSWRNTFSSIPQRIDE